MSAPETTSKGRPSLLSETAPGAPDSSSRILASLEGRVSAQQLPRRRSNQKPLVAAALAVVIGAGAFGAWQWQRAQDTAHPALAGADRSQATTIAASGAEAPPVKAAQNGPAAASTPQAAVIVADDPSSASASVSASADPLSRALASGVVGSADQPASVPSAAAASGTKPVAKAAASAPAASHRERDNAKSRREKATAAHAAKRAKGRTLGRRDDPDADLLAVLVARTKPYDAHAAVSAGAAKNASAAKSGSAAHPVSLAAQIKQCDKSNFFEAQLCRWRVCSDHWGKDPACPSTKSTATTR